MKITKTDALLLANKYNVDLNVVPISQLHYGLNVELEHTDLTKGNLNKTMKIVLAHLKESPDYYAKLKTMEKKLAKPRNIYL